MSSFRKAIPIFLTSFCVAFPALAQTKDKAAAEAAFATGRRLMEEGKLEQACPQFAESQRLDPAPGTLLNLADCYERSGKTASAWATWLSAAALAQSAGQSEREAFAKQRAQALSSRLVTLTVSVAPENRVTGLVVERDGVELGTVMWGTAVPVDPGNHVVSARAPGYRPWSVGVTVREGQPAQVGVPALTASSSPATPSPTPPPPTPVEVSTPSEPESAPSDRGKTQRILGYVAGGVGIAGVAVGSLFGLRAISKNDESKDDCRTDTLCGEKGKEARDAAFDAATISTIGFIVGGVGLGAGIVLLATAPKAGEPTSAALTLVPAVSPEGSRFTLKGSF